MMSSLTWLISSIHREDGSNSYNPRVMEKIEQDSVTHICFVLPAQETPFQCKCLIRLLPEDSHEQKDRVCGEWKGERTQRASKQNEKAS